MFTWCFDVMVDRIRYGEQACPREEQGVLIRRWRESAQERKGFYRLGPTLPVTLLYRQVDRTEKTALKGPTNGMVTVEAIYGKDVSA